MTTTSKFNALSICNGCAQSRRAFLSNCVKCLGSVGVFSGLAAPSLLSAGGCTPKQNSTVRIVFVLWNFPIQQRPTWPHIGYNFAPVTETVMNLLTSSCPSITFVQSMCDIPANAEKIIAEDKDNGNVDGYLVMQLNNWPTVIDSFVGSGKPVIFADFLYAGSGGFLMYCARILHSGVENFAHISSGNFAHLAAAAKCIPLAKGPGGMKSFVDAVRKLRVDIAAGVKVDMQCLNDKVDVLSTGDLLKELQAKKFLEFEVGTHKIGKETKESFGIDVIPLSFSELNGLWEKADKDQAMDYVKRWKSNATSITDVSDETLEKSARMYLAMKTCMKNHDACGITVNCLDGFYRNRIQAYPCLGFHELLNEGLIGACECDTLSTLTMVVMTTMTKGRPGYISDPVMDLAKKQIIYTHCVASNKVFGPQGTTNPFAIMTHSEDRSGASLRSTLPTGYMTTTLEMHPQQKEILFHQAKTVENYTEDRACRTKIACVPVGDFEKLYTQWASWGWHRVTYYGDLKKPVFALADALGWKIVEEA